MSQSQMYDPLQAASKEELAEIISSHEQLQQWNDATENALRKQEEGQLNTVLVQNIRATAALVLLSGRSFSSQNFELLRAMNLSEKTLSSTALVSGFAEGAFKAVTSPMRTLAEHQQPSDMNLEHARKRSAALEDSIMQLGSRSLDALAGAVQIAKSAWNHPEKISGTLSSAVQATLNEYQQGVNEIPKILAEGLSSRNAEQVLGNSLGVAAIGMIRNTVTASGRKMRDFSEHMKFYPDLEDIDGTKLQRVFYNPIDGHSINGYVDMQGQLHYHIIKSDGERFGHGDEMFASMLEKFRQHGVEVQSIRDVWRTGGRDSTNGLQYLDAISRGLPPEEAAFETFTGRQAKALGMENAFVPPSETGTFKPIFTKSEIEHQGQSGSQNARDVIVEHIKTLGLPRDKEQSVIDHVDQKFGGATHEDAPSR